MLWEAEQVMPKIESHKTTASRMWCDKPKSSIGQMWIPSYKHCRGLEMILITCGEGRQFHVQRKPHSVVWRVSDFESVPIDLLMRSRRCRGDLSHSTSEPALETVLYLHLGDFLVYTSKMPKLHSRNSRQCVRRTPLEQHCPSIYLHLSLLVCNQVPP